MGGVGINWNKIREEYHNGSISQKRLAEKYGVSVYSIRKKIMEECESEALESKACDDLPYANEKEAKKSGLCDLPRLCNKLTEKFAIAVEQLGDDEIDTGKLKQLVGVMKDLKSIDVEQTDTDAPLEKQAELVDVIKNALCECDDVGIFEKAVSDNAS